MAQVEINPELNFSNPADRQKIKGALQEMCDALIRKKAESDKYNEVRKMLKEEFQIPGKLSNKLAKTLYSDSFDKEVAETEEFAHLFEQIIGPKES